MAHKRVNFYLQTWSLQVKGVSQHIYLYFSKCGGRFVFWFGVLLWVGLFCLALTWPLCQGALRLNVCTVLWCSAPVSAPVTPVASSDSPSRMPECHNARLLACSLARLLGICKWRLPLPGKIGAPNAGAHRSPPGVRNWKNVSTPGVKWRVNKRAQESERSWHAFCASRGQMRHSNVVVFISYVMLGRDNKGPKSGWCCSGKTGTWKGNCTPC